MSRVFLDTNVLYSQTVTDLLLFLQAQERVQVCVSEWVRREFPRELPPFEVVRDPAFIPRGLPDPDDEPILAAALAANAVVLLTYNLRDFPRPLVGPLRPLMPDEWLMELPDLDGLLEAHRLTGQWPEVTPVDYRARLRRAQLHQVARRKQFRKER